MLHEKKIAGECLLPSFGMYHHHTWQRNQIWLFIITKLGHSEATILFFLFEWVLEGIAYDDKTFHFCFPL